MFYINHRQKIVVTSQGGMVYIFFQNKKLEEWRE